MSDISGATPAPVPDNLVEGAPVAWTDPDGTPRTGVVTDISGLSGDPASVTIAPDDDPSNVVEVPVAAVTVADAPAPADDPEDTPADGAEDVEPEESWAIVEDSPECAAVGDGSATVAVMLTNEDGSTEVDSCHMDRASAQKRLDQLNAAEAVEEEQIPDVEAAPPAASASQSTAADKLALAAAQAERIVSTLTLLGEASPELASGGELVEAAAGFTAKEGRTIGHVKLMPGPNLMVTSGGSVPPSWYASGTTLTPSAVDVSVVSPGGDVKQFEAKTVEVDGPRVAFTNLDEVSDQDLTQEIARRWAQDKAAAIVSEAQAAAEGDEMASAPVDDPDGVTCPTCSGSGSVAGGEVCPTCDGTGLVTPDDPALDAVAAAAAAPAPAKAPAAAADAAPADEGDDVATYEWDGILIVEGLPSGDGRMIAENALTWRNLPLPLMLQTVNAAGHDGSVICGSIHEIERVGQNIMFRGNFDSGTNGQEAKRLLSEGTMRGVSADIDSVVVEFLTDEGESVSFEDVAIGGVAAMEVLVAGRVMGGTLTPFPAFQEAQVQVIAAGEPDAAMVASGSTYQGDVWRVSGAGGMVVADAAGRDSLALVASASAPAETPVIPAQPPLAWFAVDNDDIAPFTVEADGRCHGLIARKGSCHIGFTDRCVPVPKSNNNYASFRNKRVLTAEGVMVATGPVYMDSTHPDLKLGASDAQTWYADTGCAVADIAVYDTPAGMYGAGAMRPGLSEDQVRKFRASDISPDWRQVNGRLEAVAALCVNVSGFIVEAMVASGAEINLARGLYDSVTGEVTALVAAGMIHTETPAMAAKRTEMEGLKAELAELKDVVRRFVLDPVAEQRVAEAKARLGLTATAGGPEPAPEPEPAAQVSSLLARLGVNSAAVMEAGTCDCEAGPGEACHCEITPGGDAQDAPAPAPAAGPAVGA